MGSRLHRGKPRRERPRVSEHNLLISADKTTIVGCACGWRLAPGGSPEEQWLEHAIAAGHGKGVMTLIEVVDAAPGAPPCKAHGHHCAIPSAYGILLGDDALPTYVCRSCARQIGLILARVQDDARIAKLEAALSAIATVQQDVSFTFVECDACRANSGLSRLCLGCGSNQRALNRAERMTAVAAEALSPDVHKEP